MKELYGVSLRGYALTRFDRDKMATVLWTTFQSSVSCIKLLHFVWSLFLKVQLVIIFSYDSLGPNMRQAIVWITDDLGYRRIYASLGRSVPMHAMTSPWYNVGFAGIPMAS